MRQRWNNKSLDKDEFVSVIFMDYSKPFDAINYELLLERLHACDFADNVLNLMCSYLKKTDNKLLK